MKVLLDYTFEEIKNIVSESGEAVYRAKQLFDGIYRGAELDDINLPKSLVNYLKERDYTAQGVKIVHCAESAIDGTKKYIFRLWDNNVIEGVLMKYKYGNTICVSTQVGCRMNCAFCASGLGGLVRNLTAGEILSQVVAVNKDNAIDDKRGVTNIVLMGSGEPLDNYDNTVKFLRLVCDERGLNVSRRNISLSTCGLCEKIKALADENYGITLTISLHAPNDEIRKKIMPVANKYGVKDIIDAVRYYFDKSGRRIIFEYSMIKGVNDSIQCADELSRLVRGLTCHVNLIRLNYVKEKDLDGSESEQIKKFMARLEKNGVSCTLRRSMGRDIDGACGQLRRKYIEGEV
ncbi:MAG: 23S rRNA (adenine(2503)-C(2))-methyltransferase RlmN [Christensenellales bacterium]